MTKALEFWEVWDPRAAATGVLIARGHMDPTDSIILHSAPDVATVEISDSDGARLAYGADLAADPAVADVPAAARRCSRSRAKTSGRQENDSGAVVMLPGGEVGILKRWWNAEDRMEWRWEVEFYNSRR